jgi:hypothetical protein
LRVISSKHEQNLLGDVDADADAVAEDDRELHRAAVPSV